MPAGLTAAATNGAPICVLATEEFGSVTCVGFAASRDKNDES